MNAGRIVLAAVAGTIVDALYGFLVYGQILQGKFSALPAVYRQPDTAVAYMPFLFGGTFLAMLAAAYIYSKGYEGGSGAKEGLAFGLAIGLFAAGYASLVNYATLNLDPSLGMAMVAAALVEWIIDGMVIGLVYKPARAR